MAIGNNEMSPADAAAALAWLIEMGADEVIGEVPVNRLLEPSEPSSRRKPGPTARRDELPNVAPGPSMGPGLRRDDEKAGSRLAPHPALRAAFSPSFDGEKGKAIRGDAVQDAKAIAAACTSLGDIVAALSGFEACPLRRTATNLCYADGNPSAHVLVIGEAPGNDEDIQGKPFVGRSGQLLDRMLRAIGLDRHAQDPARAVLITNMIFWRPPGNRKPTEPETLMCLPFVRRTVDLMRPRIILCAGATPTQRMMNVTDGILKLRGKWFSLEVEGARIPLLATLHPAYLLRQPAQKRLAWRDLLALRERLDSLSA